MTDLQERFAPFVSDWDRELARREERGYGTVSVFCGPAHAGKTARLDNAWRIQNFVGRKVQLFQYGAASKSKPRKSTTKLARGVTPTAREIVRRTPVAQAARVTLLTKLDASAVFVDDASYLEGSLHQLGRDLSESRRIDVGFAGRETDSDGNPQRNLGELMCDAEVIEKLLMPCMACHRETNGWHLRDTSNDSPIAEAICRRCRLLAKGVDVPSNAAAGSLDVLIGPVFCGKSDEAERIIKNKLTAAGQVEVFYPAELDGRWSKFVRSSTGQVATPRPVAHTDEILARLHSKATVDVVIDSIQAVPGFGEKAALDLNDLANVGRRVVVTTWGPDSRAKPVPGVPYLLCLAERVRVMHGPCEICHQMRAIRNHSVPPQVNHDGPTSPVVAPSGQEFLPRCRHHSGVA